MTYFRGMYRSKNKLKQPEFEMVSSTFGNRKVIKWHENYDKIDKYMIKTKNDPNKNK